MNRKISSVIEDLYFIILFREAKVYELEINFNTLAIYWINCGQYNVKSIQGCIDDGWK